MACVCMCGSRDVVNGTILATLTIREKAIVNNIVAIACVMDLWLATYEPVLETKLLTKACGYSSVCNHLYMQLYAVPYGYTHQIILK